MKPVLYGETHKVLEVASWQIQNTSLRELLVELAWSNFKHEVLTGPQPEKWKEYNDLAGDRYQTVFGLTDNGLEFFVDIFDSEGDDVDEGN